MTSRKCEFVFPDGEQCKNSTTTESRFCRRCELSLQRKYNFLDFPAKDFYSTHKSTSSAKLFGLMTFFLMAITIAIFVPEYTEKINFLTRQIINLETIFRIIHILLQTLLLSVLYFFSYFLLISELTKDNAKKRRFRVRAWKIVASWVFPLSSALWVASTGIGYVSGWENYTNQEWHMLVVSSFFSVYSGTVSSILKKPRLYFTKWISVWLDLQYILFGISIGILPIALEESLFGIFLGFPITSFGLMMLRRNLTGKESLTQQLISSFYKLPDILNTFISDDDRRLALAIALGKFQDLPTTQREELEKYLIREYKPSKNERIINFTKQVLAAFLIALLIEAPASFLFQNFIEQIAEK